MYKESDIAYESSPYWVLRVPTGRNKGTYEVYKEGVTHSTRCAIIGWTGQKGLDKAIAECQRRINCI